MTTLYADKWPYVRAGAVRIEPAAFPGQRL